MLRLAQLFTLVAFALVGLPGLFLGTAAILGCQSGTATPAAASLGAGRSTSHPG